MLNLTTTPDIAILPPGILLYLEKHGPFMKQAPLAWQEFWAIANGHVDKKNVVGMVGLSRIDPTQKGDAAFIYQAGVLLKSNQERVPGGLKVRSIEKGTYARFLLTGAYSQLAAAYPAAFTILEKAALQRSYDFCMEKYLNSPMDTSEAKLQTEILIPIKHGK
jgi:DNA gyrase inhibitor GyrI